MHQVRHLAVLGQFEHLRVDHDHLDLVGPARHEQAEDDRVHAHRLAGAGAAGDQQVRHLGQVVDERLAFGILAQKQRQLRLGDLAARP